MSPAAQVADRRRSFRRRVDRVALVAGVLGVGAALPLSLPDAAVPPSVWHRVFFDDFSHGLNSSRWGRYTGDPGGLWSHWGAEDHQRQTTVPGDFSRWHTLGVEWTPGRLRYLIDGRVWASMAGSHVPAERVELDLQTQAGTCRVSYAPCPDASTPTRANAQIDWVAADAYGPARR